MPSPSFESTSGLKLSLAGVPVVVRPFFFVIAVLITLADRDHPELGLAWSAAIFVSVLVHELGHALAMRSVGVEEPWIEIGGFGGLAHWNEEVRVGPGARLFVSLAGPGVQLLLAAGLFGLALSVGFDARELVATAFFGPLPTPPWDAFEQQRAIHLSLAVGFALRANVGWALVNLLPVVPLDGGHAVEELVELVTGRSGARAGRVTTVLFGALACLLAIHVEFTFAAILFGAATLRAAQELHGSEPMPDRSRGADASERLRLARAALDEGRNAEAERLAASALASNPPRREADEAHRVRAWVALREGDPARAGEHAARMSRPSDVLLTGMLALEGGRAEAALPLLERAYAEVPTEDGALGLARALFATGGMPKLRAFLVHGAGRDLPLAPFAAIVDDAHHAGAYDEAVELGALLYARFERPLDAFGVARASARLGADDEALTWLERARPYLDGRLDRLDGAEELRRLSADPRFAALRSSLGRARARA